MSTYTPIGSLLLSAPTTKITFSNIPQNYEDIVIVCQITNSTSLIYGAIQFNSDNSGTGSTAYSTTSLAVYNNGAMSDRQTNTYGIATFEKSVASSTDTSNVIITVNDYANPNKHKTTSARTGKLASNNLSGMNIGTWRNLEPITSISYDTATANGFGAGTTFNLYGIDSGAVAGTPKATGGNIVATDGTYWYHAFTNSGIFAPTSSISVDALVIGGGGGGGYGSNNGCGGGGGAGGLVWSTSNSLTSATNYQILIGAGGAGLSTPTFNAVALNGINTVAFNRIAIGGGGGSTQASDNNQHASAGGSGGAGARGANSGADPGGAALQPSSASGGYGNAGGNGFHNPGVSSNGGGGGGAGGAGASAPFGGSGAGAGGVGLTSTTIAALATIGAATGLGELSGGLYYFAGGGGGGSDTGATGAGGLGGGGVGVVANNPAVSSGTFATGGGGGAGAGNGGSGLVIVRYLV
jgi:hypothetical protein